MSPILISNVEILISNVETSSSKKINTCAVILISNFGASSSKKINGTALIGTLTVSTTAFERTKEKFFGFR